MTKVIDKSERYLKSIDNTLSEILIELKRQGRKESTTYVTLDAKSLSDIKNSEKIFERSPSSEYL
ncbi:hypothetical protein D3873_02080 [Paenisporosarcina cavernae]|uniref:Uncharacterized protein n=1 Tax=Paenisporosarcina cavernae TaxID=2320858 RepID=A0A385YRT9_9BACL|nr:hypothetical protein D3873_02080 [Paenisporosarcina cavernae]